MPVGLSPAAHPRVPPCGGRPFGLGGLSPKLARLFVGATLAVAQTGQAQDLPLLCRHKDCLCRDRPLGLSAFRTGLKTCPYANFCYIPLNTAEPILKRLDPSSTAISKSWVMPMER